MRFTDVRTVAAAERMCYILIAASLCLLNKNIILQLVKLGRKCAAFQGANGSRIG